MKAWRNRSLPVLALVLALASACTVRFLDAYSKEAEEGLLRTYGRVESLYDDIAQRDTAFRLFAPFSARYAEIHELISVQVLRESARPLNAESYGIIAQIDTLFTSYRTRHRQSNNYSNFLLERHRAAMRRMFEAALHAERIRRPEPDPQ